MIEMTLGYPVRSGNSAFKLQLALKLLPLTGTRDHGPQLG